MDLSIIIVNYNVYGDVKKCISSIRNNLSALSYEIIVIDNNSDDKSIHKTEFESEKVNYIQLDKNTGFGYANNIGMKTALGKYFLLVNPDILFSDNSIELLYNFLENNSEIGAVGPLQYKPEGKLEYYYTFFPSIYSRFMQENRMYMRAKLMKRRFFDFLDENIKRGEPFAVDWAIGSCLMVRKQIFDAIGGFDEAFFLFEEETEWQFRMRQESWLSYMHPVAKVVHNHHTSVSKLGKIFVYYHEFRSRIIFDHKRFRGIEYFIRVFLIFAGLFLRVLYFSIRSLSNRSFLVKLRAYYDLLIFSFLPKAVILNSRFDFDKKYRIFSLD